MEENAEDFLHSREERLGAPIVYKTYSTWFASIDGEEREHGVFVYSDGKTLVLEDFDRTPTLFGIPVKALKRNKYIKLEIKLPVSAIKRIETVTRYSAETSLKKGVDLTKEPNLLEKALRKLVTKITMDNESVYFIEIINKDEFIKTFENFKEEKNGSIQSL